MSYDIAILSDFENPQTIPMDKVWEVLLKNPHIQQTDSRKFIYNDGKFEFYLSLDLVDEEFNSMLFDLETFEPLNEDDERIKNKVNMIGSSSSFNPASIFGLFQLSLSISEELGWKVLDQQTGEEVE